MIQPQFLEHRLSSVLILNVTSDELAVAAYR